MEPVSNGKDSGQNCLFNIRFIKKYPIDCYMVFIEKIKSYTDDHHDNDIFLLLEAALVWGKAQMIKRLISEIVMTHFNLHHNVTGV